MATGPGTSKPNKLSWADQVEEEDNADDLALCPLPPRQVIGPDEHGIKKVIEYKFNEAGNRVKVTSTFRVRKVAMSKRAIERRSWAKFGDAVNDKAGSGLSIVSTEEIFLERSRGKGREVDETKAGGDALGQLGNKGGSLFICRTCGKKGDHFTTKCPYKDLLPQSESLNYERPSSAEGAATSSNANSNTYVPPSMRNDATNSNGTSHVRYGNKIMITNLSRNAQESDVHDLFSIFGQITRVRVAPDRHTGKNRGFAFVSFAKKEDAERAIINMDGYGYDHLILQVKWSSPAENRNE